MNPTALRALPWLVLALVVLAYAPSLGGAYIWDDHGLERGADALWQSVLHPKPRQIWRPLSVLSLFVSGALGEGPLPHRVGNLLLHLGMTALVAGTAIRHGAGRELAWFAAAVFGLHPAASEPVVWIGARTEILPALVFLGALSALAAGREWVAAALLFVAPFGKEPYLLGPATVLVWMVGRRRPAWAALGASTAGSGAYLLVRHLLTGPFPSPATAFDPLPQIGAVGLRGLRLLVDTAAPDLFARYHPAPVAGIVFTALGALTVLAVRRWPALTTPATALILLGPNVLVVSHNGLVADRYYYLPLAACAVAAAEALGGLFAARPAARPGLLRAAWVVPIALGFATFRRAGEWVDDTAVFSAALRRDPENGFAAMQLGTVVERQAGCADAAPLYQRGLGAHPDAAWYLGSCLIRSGAPDEAARVFERWSPSDTRRPDVAAAFGSAGRDDLAARWAPAP